MHRFICCLLALCCLPVHAQELSDALRAAISAHEAAPAAPLLTRKSLFPENPVQFAALAPDGRFLVSGVKQGLTTALSLLDTRTLEQRPLFANDRIRRLQWARDSRKLYFEMDNAIGVLSLDAPEKPPYITRLDRAADDYFLGPDNSSADHVLIVRQAKPDFILERVSTSGEVERLLTTDKQIDQVMVAAPDELYLVLHDTDGRDVYRYAGGEFTEIIACGLPVLSDCELLAWSQAQQTLWLNIHGDRNLGGLFAWSPATGALRALHEDPLQKTDLSHTVMLADEPLATAYDSGLRQYGLNAAAQRVLAELQSRLPGSILELTASANEIWLVKEDSAVLRESCYYLFDAARQDLQKILDAISTSDVPAPELLSRKYAVEYSASDATTIHAYLSFPKGVDLATAPLVALIHGGPWGRVVANYSEMTQLLANRGYVVFEPNYRSSTGYGRRHVLGANRDFGDGRVQQDITDGVNYLLARGIGAPDKVAIVGGSFGGFSVLAGLAFTPSLYKAGVAMVPPADFSQIIRYSLAQPSFVRRQPSMAGNLKRLLGDVNDPADMQRVYTQSPLAHLDAITAPLLLVAGADDDRIDIKHVKDYALRLLNQGNALSLLIDEDEGHGFLAEDASEANLYLTEEMLALYLGGRKEGLADALLRKYLEGKVLLNTNPGFMAGLQGNAP